jgi:hypothetical protein
MRPLGRGLPPWGSDPEGLPTMKTITLSLVLAVGLLTLVLWLLFEGGEGRRDAPSAAPSIKGEAGAEAGEALTSALLDAVGEGAARALIEAESTPEAAATEEEGQAPTNALAGRLTILDEVGGVYPSESAILKLLARGGEQRGWVTLPVEDGRFALVPRSTARLEVRSIQLLGEHFGQERMARSEVESIPAHWEGEYELRARLIPTASLRVVGTDSGRELGQVEVRMASRGNGWSSLFPGDEDSVERVWEDESSPITLPAVSGRRRYWARSPGYAWGAISYDHDQGGTQTLELQPDSSMVVVLTGESAPSDSLLRLRDPARRTRLGEAFVGQVLFETRPAADGPTHITGLPPAPYQVSVEVEDSGTIFQWGRAVATATPHEQVSVTLDLKQPKDPRVDLYGVLVLPEGVEHSSIRMDVLAQNRSLPVTLSTEPLHGEERTFSWDAGRVLPGVHVIWVYPNYFRQAVDVGSDGAEVRVELPPGVMARVRVRDSQTQESIPGAKVTWRTPPPKLLGNSDSYSVLVVALDPSTGLFPVEVPAGRVLFNASAEGYLPGKIEALVAADGPVVDLDLDQLTAIRLVYRDGDTGEVLDPGDCPEPDFERGGREELEAGNRTWTNSSSRTLSLPIGDEYTLRFPDEDGYEPVPPMTVVVGQGETLEVEVTVSPRRN